MTAAPLAGLLPTRAQGWVLLGSGLVLQLNGSTNLSMSANGQFVFIGGLPDGASYALTVGTQPSNPNQTCAVANGSGTIVSADVTDVEVTCANVITDRIFADDFDTSLPTRPAR